MATFLLSAAGTHTVDYVATDQDGLTSTSARIVFIDPVDVPSIVPNDGVSGAPPVIPPDDATSPATAADPTTTNTTSAAQ